MVLYLDWRIIENSRWNGRFVGLRVVWYKRSELWKSGIDVRNSKIKKEKPIVRYFLTGTWTWNLKWMKAAIYLRYLGIRTRELSNTSAHLALQLLRAKEKESLESSSCWPIATFYQSIHNKQSSTSLARWNSLLNTKYQAAFTLLHQPQLHDTYHTVSQRYFGSISSFLFHLLPYNIRSHTQILLPSRFRAREGCDNWHVHHSILDNLELVFALALHPAIYHHFHS